MDLSVNVLTVAVTIRGPFLNDVVQAEIELTCPLQVVPGSQFTCSIDIPRGSGMKVQLEMRDDIDTGMTPVTTTAMDIPGGNFIEEFPDNALNFEFFDTFAQMRGGTFPAGHWPPRPTTAATTASPRTAWSSRPTSKWRPTSLTSR